MLTTLSWLLQLKVNRNQIRDIFQSKSTLTELQKLLVFFLFFIFIFSMFGGNSVVVTGRFSIMCDASFLL